MTTASQQGHGERSEHAPRNIVCTSCSTKAIIALAYERAYFTADDVRERTPRCHSSSEHVDPRSLGGLMLRAKRNGFIKPTQIHQRSRSNINHHRPIRVWKSIVFDNKGEIAV